MAARILTTALVACLVGLAAAPANAQSPWCAQQLRSLDALDYGSRLQVVEMCQIIDRVQRKVYDQERLAEAAKAEAKQKPAGPSEQECREAYRAGCFVVLHRRDVTDTTPVPPPPCKWCR